jgi:putative membrane protein
LFNAPVLAACVKLNDAQIAHISYTAVIDVTAEKKALSISSCKETRAFAEDMVRDHEAVNKLALDLVKKLNVTPKNNERAAVSRKLLQRNSPNWQS